MHLKMLDPFIGDHDLRQVHMGALRNFIAKRKADGLKTKTLNATLAVVRRILNLAASEWIDEKGMTWLDAAPKIKLLPVKDARSPYPLTQEEQGVLFQELPDHLARMALFKVNKGCREQEVCGLRWDYEVKVPELDTSVFLIPKEQVKNGEERLVVLNRVAKSAVESLRGLHPTHVFVRVPKEGRGEPVTQMNNTAWKSAASEPPTSGRSDTENQHRTASGRFESMISSTRSVAACGLLACRSRTDRTYSATRAGGSPRTTLKPS
jgi:integrase